MWYFRITIIITRATNFSTMSSRREIEKWKIDIVKKFFDVKVEDENSEEVARHIINLVVDAAAELYLTGVPKGSLIQNQIIWC